MGGTRTGTLVIGGGIAGCAAAAAVGRQGGRCVLIEARLHLGGVAAMGEHRSLCGLSPLDASGPTLLEPELVAPWLPLIVSAEPFRQGRVWLWPTRPQQLMHGLRAGLRQAGVEVRLGSRICAAQRSVEGVVLEVRHADGGSERVAPASVIDASGEGVLASLLQLARAPAQQWASCRAVVQLPTMAGTARAGRVRLLAAMQRALDHEAALAVVPLGGGCWQLSLDVAPGSAVAEAEASVRRAALAVEAEVLAVTLQLAERDQGRPLGTLSLEQLFAQQERGLCWAAWPREEHTAHGVRWTYPPRERYGVPRSAVEVAAAPGGCFFIGKSMPVETAAAAALRVTGTCLAIGAAVGVLCAAPHPP